MKYICSFCGGILKVIQKKDSTIFICQNCFKKKEIKKEKEIDMSNDQTLFG